MRAKEDGTQGREIKQLPASSSVGPFIMSTCPGPLTRRPSSFKVSHINIHVHRGAITWWSHRTEGWGSPRNQQHHLLPLGRKPASVRAWAVSGPVAAKAF